MHIKVKGKTVKDLIEALKELDENRPLEDFSIKHNIYVNGNFGEATQTDNYIFTFKISESKKIII